ncbi:MAG: leucine--tRNA ligase [Phycisphaeraceae bacterium]|nr:leucine--tRNA ligase [Phycisphaeraceae bacterium]
MSHETQTPQTPARAGPRHRYDAAMANTIEPRWQQAWKDQGAFTQPNPGQPGFDASRPKFYCLDMFPYPSGAGLHVGHPEGYTATDIICRFRRMKGYNVLHPMGWDAFGLPAEQYAIQTGVHPAITTRQAIDNFRRQLQRFGFCYDWSREFGTIDEDYYGWTQWIFLRLYGAWYDARARRGRPITELIAEFEAGKRPVRLNPDAAEYTGAGDLPGGTAAGEWSTLDPETQRAIVDSYRLAYVALQTVNWCPKLGTALANEEVIDGKSERGGFPVYRKPLRQWLFRITAYADRLLEGLGDVDWPASTRAMQEAWIGKSEGAEIDFPILDRQGRPTGEALRVFTTRPDTIFGATYMVVAPEHPLVNEALEFPAPETDVPGLRAYVDAARNRSDVERMEARTKTGAFTGEYVRNPANGEHIPVWTSDYVLMGYGTGAIMAVPGQDQRDWDFATAFGLPIVRTVQPPEGFDGDAYTGEGPAINSGFLDGLGVADAKRRMIEWLEAHGAGVSRVHYRLRDWLFSRQRYWGEPFPIVYDSAGRHHAVSDDALPVRLPELADYKPEESDEPRPLLAKATDWVTTTARKAGVRGLPPDAPVKRETNTMPGWAGSCWYFLRFCDSRNPVRFVGTDAEAYWMGGGVDLYIGGAEHAVLHLLYARFWHKVLFDLGLVSAEEPFRKLFHQGLITSFAYQREDTTLVPVDDVKLIECSDVSKLPEPDLSLGVQPLPPATGIAVIANPGLSNEARSLFEPPSLSPLVIQNLQKHGGSFYFEAVKLGDPLGPVTTAVPVTDRTVAKMSKSLKNVINPDDVIAQYGADTFRLYEMYMGPLDASKPWNPRDIGGLFRFLQRVWRVVIDEDTGSPAVADAPGPEHDAIERQLHRTIAKVEQDIERLAFNTAIASMIELVNLATSAREKSGVLMTRDQALRFCRVLAPFAPHIAEELWHLLGGQGLVSLASWPAHDPAMLTADSVEIPVQILGKVRHRLTVPADADAKKTEAIAMADERVLELIRGKEIKKVVVVPGRMVNIVVGT